MTENRKYQRHDVEGMGIHAKSIFNAEVNVLDISRSGGSIRSTKRFNMGGEYIFKFEHKLGAISIKSVIVWEKLTGSKKIAEGEIMPVYTAGIEFQDVSADKAELLKEFIEDKIQEFREHKLSGIRVKVHGPEKAVLSYLETCVVKNISFGGIRIETGQEPSLETIFPLELILTENKNSIRCSGRVAFYHQIPEETPQRYSVGVEFLDMLDDDKLRLDRFIKTLPGDL